MLRSTHSNLSDAIAITALGDQVFEIFRSQDSRQLMVRVNPSVSTTQARWGSTKTLTQAAPSSLDEPERERESVITQLLDESETMQSQIMEMQEEIDALMAELQQFQAEPEESPQFDARTAPESALTCEVRDCNRRTTRVFRACCSGCPSSHTRTCNERQKEAGSSHPTVCEVGTHSMPTADGPSTSTMPPGSSTPHMGALPRRAQPEPGTGDSATSRTVSPTAVGARPCRAVSSLPNKWWAITRVPAGEEQKFGIAFTTCYRIQVHLGIRGGLKGTGYHCQSFATQDGAVTHWCSDGWVLPAPRLTLSTSRP